MLTKSELERLLASTETYRVERTKSTTDKDKFGEAVCAFANDMPDCGKPGYLFIGVDNEGCPCGMKARMNFCRSLRPYDPTGISYRFRQSQLIHFPCPAAM
ncbi:MAG: putative DNA binding domain-containing protein [Kiritimatiellae bacterium]|nr:putative DNA binding domain-containing protein [Kiritimatiellia bacterium]